MLHYTEVVTGAHFVHFLAWRLSSFPPSFESRDLLPFIYYLQEFKKMDKENEMEFLFDLRLLSNKKKSTTRRTSRIEIPRKNSVDRS